MSTPRSTPRDFDALARLDLLDLDSILSSEDRLLRGTARQLAAELRHGGASAGLPSY